MNNFYDVLNNHRSIRKYKKKEIPEEVIEKILQTGMRASSSGNMQPYSIILTKDKKIKEQLLPYHFNQSMVMDAPILVTFCSDFNRMRLWLEYNDAPENFDNLMSFMIGAIDATLASQNVALAAEAEGLGICYMGTTLASCDNIAKILELPPNVVPVVGFSLGYPDENPPLRDRLPLKGIIHREKYQNYSKDQIYEIYHKKETEGMKRYKANPELRKLIDSSDVKNLAQVYTKIKYTQESHLEYSKEILNYLSAHNFLNH